MLKRERTNVYDFSFHLIFVTKYRKEIFTTNKLRDDMKNILLGISNGNPATIENIKVMPDHIHMLISFKPRYAPVDIVKSFKGTSARLWFKEHPETKAKLWDGHLWSPNYFMSTIGNISKKIVNQYIEDQIQRPVGRPKQKNVTN